MNDALPFLLTAKEVCVVTINPEFGISGQGDNPAADVVTHLSRHGITATARITNAERGALDGLREPRVVRDERLPGGEVGDDEVDRDHHANATGCGGAELG